ncbi:4942_t:CDS:2 [Funneliformis geosporum]|uniref:4942_t:CDS:1 n=1 Tax=Funneliformis geosporum TaxID=1117311 RepID=A0A9W4WUH0_9GLOM|nr:4942_t:CDS:2 [Funneliformis geosporum]
MTKEDLAELRKEYNEAVKNKEIEFPFKEETNIHSDFPEDLQKEWEDLDFAYLEAQDHEPEDMEDEDLNELREDYRGNSFFQQKIRLEDWRNIHSGFTSRLIKTWRSFAGFKLWRLPKVTKRISRALLANNSPTDPGLLVNLQKEDYLKEKQKVFSLKIGVRTTLSITINPRLYQRLKEEIGDRKVSSFVEKAIAKELDIRLVGEILLVILAISFAIYREFKEKGKITKIKKKLEEKDEQINQAELEKYNLERKNSELVAENQKLKRELKESEDFSGLEGVEIINRVIIKNFKIDCDANFINISPQVLEILKGDLNLNAQAYYENEGWKRTAFDMR